MEITMVVEIMGTVVATAAGLETVVAGMGMAVAGMGMAVNWNFNHFQTRATLSCSGFLFNPVW